MQTEEQIATKRAAAAVLLDIHPDRIVVCRVSGDIFIDDRPKPVRKKELAIIALKAMLMEWLGWADNAGVTADLASHYGSKVHPIIERDDLIGAAGLAKHLRETA